MYKYMYQNNGANGVAMIGNTKSSPSKEKREIQYKSWCFTLNNYTPIDLVVLRNYFAEDCEKVVIGFEVGEQGTKHLQGYFMLKKKMRFSQFKGIDALDRSHIEKCKNDEAAQKYCQKDGNIMMTMGHVFKPLICITDLYLWQRKLNDLLFDKPDQRTVYWIYEETGNVGKSAFIRYHLIHETLTCGFCDGGKKSDVINMVFNLKGSPDVIFFDLPRENQGKISYSAIESLKNGVIFNSKFESGFKVFNYPHVVVFSNFRPDNEEKLSKDRWKIFEIKNKDLINVNALP